MSLLKFLVERKILIGLMVVFVLLVGSYSLTKVDKELMPPIDFDAAYVNVNAGEMAAIEVERTITTPLEQKILGLDGVEGVDSTTNIGRSSLQVVIESGRGDDVTKEIQSIVSATTSTISGVKEVVTDQVGTTQSYDFFMDVSAGDMKEITTFAKDVLEPRLEELQEVNDVLLSGFQENEVAIQFDREKVAEKGIDVMQVVGVIQQSNSEATIGEFSSEEDSPSLRWDTKLTSVEDLENLKIVSSTGMINLEEIAEVTLQPLDNSNLVWKNGTKDFVFVQVGRVSDVTQIEMAEAVRAEIKNIREEGLVEGFELNEMVAQADYVKDSIDGVTSNILIGGIIAIVILMLFLRNIRATIIVGLSIPTSVLLTFTAMWLFDYSFNMLTLIGLGLGIGMMVDSSIVILESIYRKKEQGTSNFKAVIEGTKEVATAVIASMLTTIVVFLPIGLLGGEMGQFMMMLSAVVAITLIASVIVSFTLIPSLSENFLKLSKKKKVKKEGPLLRGYIKTVQWSVKKKRYSFAVIGIFILMFVSSLAFVTKIPMTIMPDVLNRYQELMVTVETGLSTEEKEKVVSEINKILSSIQDVESNYLMDNGNMFYTVINMTKGDDITREQKEVNEEIFSSLRKLQDTLPIQNVASPMSAGGGSPVQVNIKGEDFKELQTIGQDFITELEKIDGIVGVANSIERTSVQEVIEIDEAAIEDAGLSKMQIKQFIETSFLQMPVGEISIDEESYAINVKWDEKIESKASLLDLTIPTATGDQELSSFISLASVDTPNEISHVDGERLITISADIEERDLGAINRDVQKLITSFETTPGYTVEVAGDLEQQQQLMQEMLMILGIAIFLVYLVMAVQFNSLSHPIVVMSVIPMTAVGVILGLLLTQRELSIMSGMGVVMLIGIVLNNAILLIDRTNQLRKEGYGVEAALVEAGKNRVRPIFMTTLTTVGGMLPLALASGSSGNYQAPMATVIISGLMFATLITLLLIPTVYRLFDAFGIGVSRIGKRRKKMTKQTDEATEAAS
ncbi:HAE1 family hydrophobic/amphiphilic exporter-1 [Bacillus mesophilus]|uniref:Efflux RND transporter permease subunit n=1 Tax=Bacillus mesophilus TaxID=1808955 RepID=A0A6M0Q540_9BACI|nr:efflux RND transporter permease subunit [Bacillus mesophilus]MBM7660973.1 HAE1 family hydrophobic/amphiphilic exporter-1 [Bacillus mesophilus]NEY71485.1 efflux RND transporter permease subunit [Bacillus mesophilus]